MAAWGVSEETVAALNQMADGIDELLQQQQAAAQRITEAFEENECGLGAHSAEILALIRDVEATEEEAAGQVRKLLRKVRFAAMTRRKHIENNGYKKSDGESPARETAAILGRIYDGTYRSRIVPHEQGDGGRQVGNWKGETFVPEDSVVPEKSNPEGMTFGQIRKGLKERYDIEFSGVPYRNGYADFSSVAVAQVDWTDVVDMRVKEDASLIDSKSGGVDFEKLFAKRTKNFDCADKIAAQKQVKIKGLPEGYTAADLKKWRKENKFSWDETYDNGYILVPRIVHDNVRHTGLVGVATHGTKMEENSRIKLGKRAKASGKSEPVSEEDAIISITELERKAHQ